MAGAVPAMLGAAFLPLEVSVAISKIAPEVLGHQFVLKTDYWQLPLPKNVFCLALICVICLICGQQHLCGGFVNSPQSHRTV
jgi:hypothetical protein